MKYEGVKESRCHGRRTTSLITNSTLPDTAGREPCMFRCVPAHLAASERDAQGLSQMTSAPEVRAGESELLPRDAEGASASPLGS